MLATSLTVLSLGTLAAAASVEDLGQGRCSEMETGDDQGIFEVHKGIGYDECMFKCEMAVDIDPAWSAEWGYGPLSCTGFEHKGEGKSGKCVLLDSAIVAASMDNPTSRSCFKLIRGNGMPTPNTVFGVSDPDKADFALKNANAHVSGYLKLGVDVSMDDAAIRVVMNGFSFSKVMKEGGTFGTTTWEPASQTTIDLVDGLIAKGVKVYMCRNTATAVGFTVDDLIDGFELADYGATVMIAQLEGDGWSYVRS